MPILEHIEAINKTAELDKGALNTLYLDYTRMIKFKGSEFLSSIKNRSIKEKMDLPGFDDFLLSLKVNNYSLETVYDYGRELKAFKKFLSVLPFDKIIKKTIIEYKAYLLSKNLAAVSINRNLTVIRSYLKYLIDMDYQIPIPPDAIRLLKTPRLHSRVADLKDIIRLVEFPSFFEKEKRIALRNRAILEVLFSTGMRISELVNLNRNQIDNSGRIFIIGKGKKERFVYLTPRAKKYLKKYLATRKDSLESLFISYKFSPFANRLLPRARIPKTTIQEAIKMYREKLKINIRTSAHSLRHAFATYLAEQGANPAAIQILLGHESLVTTTRYIHASDKFAEETHRKFHPLQSMETPSNFSPHLKTDLKNLEFATT